MLTRDSQPTLGGTHVVVTIGDQKAEPSAHTAWGIGDWGQDELSQLAGCDPTRTGLSGHGWEGMMEKQSSTLRL